MKKRAIKPSFIFIALMFITAALPALLFILGVKPGNVRRAPLVSNPSLIRNGRLNASFAKDAEKYFAYWFPAKDVFVRALDEADTLILKDLPGGDAVPGREGYLFFGDTMNDITGADQLSAEEIETIVRYLDSINRSCEEKGIRFCFVTAPDKGTVYPDMLPGRLYVTDEARSITLLSAALNERGAGYFIDAEKLLLGSRANGDCYYKRDSHWNEYGACLVYNEIAGHYGLEKYDDKAYSLVKDREGDLERYAAGFAEVYDERFVYPEKRPYSSDKHVDFDRSKLNITYSDANDITVLVWHDSFGKALQPFLSQNAGRLVMLRDFPYDTESLEEYSPDILIIEIAERKLPKLYELAKASGC